MVLVVGSCADGGPQEQNKYEHSYVQDPVQGCSLFPGSPKERSFMAEQVHPHAMS